MCWMLIIFYIMSLHLLYFFLNIGLRPLFWSETTRTFTNHASCHYYNDYIPTSNKNRHMNNNSTLTRLEKGDVSLEDRTRNLALCKWFVAPLGKRLFLASFSRHSGTLVQLLRGRNARGPWGVRLFIAWLAPDQQPELNPSKQQCPTAWVTECCSNYASFGWVFFFLACHHSY